MWIYSDIKYDNVRGIAYISPIPTCSAGLATESVLQQGGKGEGVLLFRTLYLVTWIPVTGSSESTYLLFTTGGLQQIS